MRTRYRSRVGWQLKWIARTPLREVLRHPEWLLQEFGLSRLFWRRRHEGGLIRHVSPEFMRSHTVPLVDPAMVPADAACHVRDEDTVLGLAMDGVAHAYPWWQVDDHHIVNDTVGSQRVMIIFCEACSTAVAFDPVVNGRRLIFRQTHHYNGTIAAGDDLTRSVWSPYLGKAIRGKLRGTTLPLLPIVHTTWGRWKEQYPETLVLPPEIGEREGHGSRHSPGGEHVQVFSRVTISRWDTRLPHNELVLGVLLEGAQRAYPLKELLRNGGVANDEIGDEPVVLLADPEGRGSALAFSRRVGGRTLRFRADDGGAVDEETSSRWSFRGEAVAGPMAGSRLEFVASHVSEWFVWPAHYPEITIGPTRASR